MFYLKCIGVGILVAFWAVAMNAQFGLDLDWIVKVMGLAFVILLPIGLIMQFIGSLGGGEKDKK